MPNASQTHHYVLDEEGNPCREHDIERWVEWMLAHMKPLAETWLATGVQVVTRYRGRDQRRIKEGAPMLWETIILGGLHDRHHERYTSQADALKGHERAVALAKDEST